MTKLTFATIVLAGVTALRRCSGRFLNGRSDIHRRSVGKPRAGDLRLLGQDRKLRHSRLCRSGPQNRSP